MIENPSKKVFPNSGPATIQNFPLFDAVKKAFWTSALNTAKSFKAAKDLKYSHGVAWNHHIVRDRSWSPYLMTVGAVPGLPSKVFTRSLMSNTHKMSSYLGNNPPEWCLDLAPSKSSNAMRTFCISSLIASIHKVFPFSLSILIPSLYLWDSRYPTCVYVPNTTLTWPFVASIRFCFCRIYEIRHARAGPSSSMYALHTQQAPPDRILWGLWVRPNH